MPPSSRDEFEIAIICALPFEADSVVALFDEKYDMFGKRYWTQPEDNNTYITGRIGLHHVVLCILPGMGKSSAAAAASNLRTSYRNVQLALLVGVCGGVPFPYPAGKEEILLADVIISHGVVEYDFGRDYPDGFRRKTDFMDVLGRPAPKIRGFLAGLNTRDVRAEVQAQAYQHLQVLKTKSDTWQCPGIERDVLFEPSYRHKHYRMNQEAPCVCIRCHSKNDHVCDQALENDCTTLGCSGSAIRRKRPNTRESNFCVHIGKVASADRVLKSGEDRDEIAAVEGVIAFEMEGAGAWDNIPCIIIKGVCDYADSHKNKLWQAYAAATAASVSKAFLLNWPVASESCTTMKPTTPDLALALRSYYTRAAARRLQVQRISGEQLPMERCYINMVLVEKVRGNNHREATDLSLFSRLKVDTVEERHVSIPELFMAARRILIHGRAGVGKTTLCKKIMHDYLHRGLWSELFDLILWIPLRRLKRRSQQNSTIKGAFYDLYFSDISGGDDFAAELEKAMMDPARNDRVLLILDGLDEVSQEWEPESPMHNLLVRLLDHPRVIITSRPYGLGISDLDSFDKQLETVGFTDKQVEAYVQMATKGDFQTCDDILTFITDNEFMRHLARIPVQLDAICYSWDCNFMSGNTPKTMTLLYEAITLKLWQKDVSRLQRLNPCKDLNEETIRAFSMLQIGGMIPEVIRLLEILAFTGMYNELIEYKIDDRHRLYNTLIQQGTLIPSMPESVFRSISFLHTSDVSVLDSDITYHFLHLTFQEFFAARYIVRHWIENKEMECINLRQRTTDIAFMTPQAFLQMHKYSSRYDIMWRFVTGLLQNHPQEERWSENPVVQYFEQLDHGPRDLLGPAHQRLLMHCLSEVVPGARGNRIRAGLERQLLPWLHFEFERGIPFGLMMDSECPEHLLVQMLQGHSVDVHRKALWALKRPNRLSLTTLQQVLRILEDQGRLEREARDVLLKQIQLPSEILEGLFSLPRAVYSPRLAGKMAQQVCNYPEMVKRLPLYQKSDNLYARLAAGKALARQPLLPPGGLDALLLLLQDTEGEVRAAVAEELSKGHPHEPKIIDALISLLLDENSSVRAAVAKAWGSHTSLPPEARHTLHQMLEDEDEAVKISALLALGRHQSVAESTIDVLVPILNRARLQVVPEYIWDVLDLLERQKCLPRQIVEVLLSLLEELSGRTRLKIAGILSQQPPSLTTNVQTLVHDYYVLSLYTRDKGYLVPSMPADHQSTIIRIFQDVDLRLDEQASHALLTQTHLSPNTLHGLVQMLDPCDYRSYRASQILYFQSALPMEITDSLLMLLGAKCNEDLMCRVAKILAWRISLPPQIIDRLVAMAKIDELRAIMILSQQPNLSPAIMEELLPVLDSKNSYSRAFVADMVMKNTQVLANLPANYWGALYKVWIEDVFEQQISCSLKDNCLRLHGPDGVTEIQFSHTQLLNFREEIRKAQLELGIPADTLLPKSLDVWSISRLVHKVGALFTRT